MSRLFKSKYPKFAASSVDPYKLSTTIKGFLTAVIPVVLMLAPMFNWNVTAEDFTNVTNGIDGFFEAIQAVIVAVTAGISAFWILWGAVRKVLVAMKFIKVS